MNKRINQTNKQKNLCKSISAGQFREIGLYRHFIIDEKTRKFSGTSIYWVYLYNERIRGTLAAGTSYHLGASSYFHTLTTSYFHTLTTSKAHAKQSMR